MYSDKLIQLFTKPKNVGIIKNAQAIGEVGTPTDSDYIKMYISVENDVVQDAKFKAFGNPVTIAFMSILTGMIKGQTMSQVYTVDGNTIVNYIGELPKGKEYLVPMINTLMADLIKDYEKRLEKLNKDV